VDRSLNSIKNDRGLPLWLQPGRILRKWPHLCLISLNFGNRKEKVARYLFDTDIITNIFKEQPFPGLLARLAELPRNQQHLSSITLSEFVYGAYKSDRPDYHMSNLQNILFPSVNILGFDSKVAYACGRLRAELEKAGTPFALADIENAAIALAHKLVLVTGNSRHFAKISGLTVQNWLA